MAVIASSEFIALCQAQLQLLTTQMTASASAVYMTDYLVDGPGQYADQSVGDAPWRYGTNDRTQQTRQGPNFVPVVSYPDSIESWIEQFERSQSSDSMPPLLPATAIPDTQRSDPQAGFDGQTTVSGNSISEPTAPEPTAPEPTEHPSADQPERDQPEHRALDHQLVVPLVYSEVVVGLIVTIRRDRSWKAEERHYVEGVAQALAAGCVLERRSQWLQHQLTDKRDLQSRQSEIFHNLLHQFRNPLTAVTTFGQLLVRRLESEDPNQKIATGIVRESKRLREMVSHFDETVAIGDADLQAEAAAMDEPLLLPPATKGLLPATANTSGPDTQPEAAQPAAQLEDYLDQPHLDQPHLDQPNVDDSPVEMGAGLGHSLTLSAQYLPELLEPILAVTEIVAQEKGVKIYAQVAADTPPVWGEAEALSEVVSNLVDNAVKYSPAGAGVFVQTGVSQSRDSHHYQGIVVGDSGPGIPADDLPRLFERSYRGVQAEGDIPGTGLGLAIARALIAQMQGAIEVVSPAVGTPWLPQSLIASTTINAADLGPGTVFIVWLPEVEHPSTSVYSPMSALR